MDRQADDSGSGLRNEATAEMRVDPFGMVLSIDPDIERIVARRPNDFVGRSALMWIHPSDCAATECAVIGALGTPGTSIPLRVRVGSDSDGWRPVACTIRNPGDSSELNILIKASRAFTDGEMDHPITARPPIEANPLAELIEDPAIDGLLMATASAPVFLSPSMIATFGATSNDFFTAFGDLLHPDDSDRIVDLLTRLTEGTEPYVQITAKALRVDGKWGRYRIRTRDLSQDPDYELFVTAIHPLDDGTAESTNIDDSVDPRIRHALNLASDPIMVITDDGRIRFASTSTSSLIGHPASSVTSRPLVELITDDTRSIFETWWRDPRRPSCQVRFVTVDNAPRWISIRTVESGTSESDLHRGLFRVVALRDTDELVKAEEALQRREARFAALMQNSSSGVVVLGADDRVVAPGHALEQVLGIRSDLATGLLLTEWVHVDDRATVRAALATARSRRGPTTATVRQRIATNRWRWIHWTIEDLSTDSSINGVVVNLADRTDEVEARIDLELSERRFRAIVDHSFEVTVIANADFEIMWASPSIEELLGWGNDVVVGQAILDFVHPEDVTDVLVRFDRALNDNGPSPSIPVRIQRADGTWRYVIVVAADRRDDPDIGGIILNVRDAEDQVASEVALSESETRYRMLVENSSDVVAILERDATVKWVSPTVEHVLGHRAEELVGQALGGVDERVERDEMLTVFSRVLDVPGATERAVAKLKHADGSWRWVDAAVTNRLDEPGIDGLVVAYRDVTERVEADRSRQASEERFRSLSESSPLGIFQLDREHRCIYVNDRWCEITGQHPTEAMGDAWSDPIRKGGTELTEFGPDLRDFSAFDPGIPIVRTDGSTRWCSLHIAPLTDDRGKRIGSVGTIDDITSTVLARHEARRLSSILASSPDLVLVFTPTSELVYLNEAARHFFLVDPDEPINGLTAMDILDEENLRIWTDAITPTLEDGKVWQGEVVMVNSRGDSMPISAVVNVHQDPTGSIEVVSITARDMTERAELEARLEHQATHDPLTGLPNRALLLDRLGVAMARASRGTGKLAVLFADLDRFKVVNDGLGHAVGDELLRLVADRLESTLRPGDTVARLGGDEFVIVCEDLVDIDEAEAIAERLSASVTRPATIGGSEVVVSVSIGIALVADTSGAPDELIRDADAAMYLAKQHGRARWEIFDPDLRNRAANRLSVENALRRAIQTDELELFYQPVVDADTLRPIGAEALLRWRHPEQGLLAPGAFLDVAEESGLIVPIGDWVLAKACEQTQAILDRDPRFSISVNLSARQIDDPGLIARIDTIVNDASIPPEQLVLEITESTLMGDAALSGATLAELRHLGIGLAIDDFGTGYSSLAYLQRYPIDVLKIDRSFVSGLGHEAGDEAIVEAIIALARALGLRTIAEGVETRTQLETLRRVGCSSIQGYLTSRPLPVAEFESFISTHSS